MAQCDEAPPRGTYVEIRRQNHSMIGKVMWSNGCEFGVMLSDAIDVEGLVAGKAPVATEPGADRRRNRTRRVVLTTAADWRWVGQTFERACLTVGVVLMVAVAGLMAYEALSTPMEAVAASLN